MQIKILIQKHQPKLRHSLLCRYDYDRKTITLDDQEDACKNPWLAYAFAKLNIPGTDIKKCQESACRCELYAFHFALEVLGANIAYCRKACESVLK